MTSSSTNSKLRRHTPPTRVLAFLLFAIILHGATAEIVHQHGGLSHAGAVVNTTTPSASDAEDSDSTLNQTRTRGECAICQLHQHLSTTLFSTLPQIVPPSAQFVLSPADSTSYSSKDSTTERGRGPPLASLF